MMRKMNITNWCNKEKCSITYEVLIHTSKNTINNDLFSSDPVITIGSNVSKIVEISKINMDSISTEKNPCAKYEMLTRIECKMDKVKYLENCTIQNFPKSFIIF